MNGVTADVSARRSKTCMEFLFMRKVRRVVFFNAGMCQGVKKPRENRRKCSRKVKAVDCITLIGDDISRLPILLKVCATTAASMTIKVGEVFAGIGPERIVCSTGSETEFTLRKQEKMYLTFSHVAAILVTGTGGDVSLLIRCEFCYVDWHVL
jgi:hypothetical protein